MTEKFNLTENCFNELYDYLDRHFDSTNEWYAKGVNLLKKKVSELKKRFLEEFGKYDEELVNSDLFITREFLGLSRESKKFINNLK